MLFFSDMAENSGPRLVRLNQSSKVSVTMKVLTAALKAGWISGGQLHYGKIN